MVIPQKCQEKLSEITVLPLDKVVIMVYSVDTVKPYFK